MTQETLERTFSVAIPARLAVSNIRGSVDILPGDDNRVSVKAVKHLNTGDADRTHIELAQDEAGHVTIATRFQRDYRHLSSFFKRQACKVEYTVRVPRACHLKVACVNSTASIRGLQGEFDVSTVSGRLSLRAVSGTLKLSGVSGKIFGERLSGPVHLESIAGKVRLIESHLPTVEGSTTSGDIVIQTTLAEGPYRLTSVSGDVTLIVPPGAGCVIDAQSVSGRVTTSLPNVRYSRRGRGWRVEMQGGGPEIRFRSASGDLRVAASDELPSAEAASPARREWQARIDREEASADVALHLHWT